MCPYGDKPKEKHLKVEAEDELNLRLLRSRFQLQSEVRKTGKEKR